MAVFMDVHHNMKGLSAADLKAAHDADLAIQHEENVNFKSAGANPESGLIYCLSGALSAEAVQRIHDGLVTRLRRFILSHLRCCEGARSEATERITRRISRRTRVRPSA